jgi:hypothetical protein
MRRLTGLALVLGAALTLFGCEYNAPMDRHKRVYPVTNTWIDSYCNRTVEWTDNEGLAHLHNFGRDHSAGILNVVYDPKAIKKTFEVDSSRSRWGVSQEELNPAYWATLRLPVGTQIPGTSVLTGGKSPVQVEMNNVNSGR